MCYFWLVISFGNYWESNRRWEYFFQATHFHIFSFWDGKTRNKADEGDTWEMRVWSLDLVVTFSYLNPKLYYTCTTTLWTKTYSTVVLLFWKEKEKRKEKRGWPFLCKYISAEQPLWENGQLLFSPCLWPYMDKTFYKTFVRLHRGMRECQCHQIQKLSRADRNTLVMSQLVERHTAVCVRSAVRQICGIMLTLSL